MQVSRRIQNFGLPLLAKELLEQAARKRTYIVRVAYAALLFFTAFVFFHDTLKVGSASPLAVLGRGQYLFSSLVGLQFAGVYFFMPAMTCSVLTQEKERASLQLLFLTRLGPWTILFEKLTSRLIPMFGFLLLSLPLLAFAYTLGGISPAYLASGVWLLVLAVIQTGTLALACSAYFRTTVGAFIWTYILGLVMFFGPVLFWLSVASLTGFEAWTYPRQHGWGNNCENLIMLPLFGPPFFEPRGAGGVSLMLLIAHSILVLAASACFLVLARVFIVRRAFAPPGNAVLNVFKLLDAVFLRLNNNPLTRGMTFVGETARLPGDEPVAWRETAKLLAGQSPVSHARLHCHRVAGGGHLPDDHLCVAERRATDSPARPGWHRVGADRFGAGRQPDRRREIAPDTGRAVHDASLGTGNRSAEISIGATADARPSRSVSDDLFSNAP